MQRNLDKRVELVFPVEDEDIKNRVEQILKVMLKDTVNARKQLTDTTYHLVDKRGKKRLNCQKYFSKLAQQAQKAVKKQTYVRTVGTPIVPAKEGEKAE